MHKYLFLLFIYLFINNTCKGQSVLKFPSKDGLLITADLYKVNDTGKYIILCHLAQHSRGEYIHTAKRLNEAGYNCLAIDTRTGNEIFGIKNQTAIEARQLNKPTDFLSSEQDIIAAIDYCDSLAGHKGVILLGSSFSASLSLKIAAVNPKVNAVAAFSPGEHFGKQIKLKKMIKHLGKKTFLTSSKEESKEVTKIFRAMKSKDKTQFIPSEKGAHGAIALWSYNENNQEYWDALLKFLGTR